jgi:hypothetical protein
MHALEHLGRGTLQLAGCALSLAQHAAFPTMAGAHGVSCVGAHVAALAPGASRLISTALATTTRNSTRDALLAAMPLGHLLQV